ncbi:hypothetical protein FAM21834_01531 [Lentilactobacillus parabuchneri]|jgi:hypothetical protein|uniref:Uncharacterized protein n=2 Tax=Lentilactobacillus parabuchneri TaxID=152331 RepID=A0A1X1FEH2_9LACO|nr:hypothetical protein [Lentilactobacillus parabuchneri]APR07649.1 hypothetical protein FAM21731_01472 [Lentilactobacillus parabuchneri]KRM46056.1 hypothetical protein FC51_GL000635 [Lentilactobacillus parabuchneri DSM 5707 = NBRC 107865]KRN72811.1 hypothetical protein IV42_GL001286 [Lentilactobacillus parabuchneri]MBW0222877.1 hypothetical protein [Lentilactobacillus parabuchneri]MBW0246021.1 hypothetical protein [Lentilactobacillus parabuchneri]
MKKWKVLLRTVALSLGLIFAIGSSNNVSAATWHKGTPKALRGTWKRGSDNGNNKWMIYQVYKSSYVFGWMGMSAEKVTGIKYRVLGNFKYELVGHGHKNGLYNGGKETIRASRHGNIIYSTIPNYVYRHHYYKFKLSKPKAKPLYKRYPYTYKVKVNQPVKVYKIIFGKYDYLNRSEYYSTLQKGQVVNTVYGGMNGFYWHIGGGSFGPLTLTNQRYGFSVNWASHGAFTVLKTYR